LEDARRIRHEAGAAERPEAGFTALLDQHRALERLLPVGGHDGSLRDAAAVRIAHAPRVLAEEEGQALLSLARPVRRGIDDHLHAHPPWRRPNRHQPEPEATAQTVDVTPDNQRSSSSAAHRSRDGEIDPIGDRQPLDTLKKEGEIEPQLELHDDGLLSTTCAHDVAAGDFALDLVSLPDQKRLHRRVQIGFDEGQSWRRHRP